MDGNLPFNRRRLLKLLAAGGISGLAGCSESRTTDTQSATTSDTPSEFTADTPSNTSTETAKSDTQRPQISTATSKPSSESGVLTFQFEGEDNQGINEVTAETTAETVTNELNGKPVFQLDGQLRGTLGDLTEVSFSVSDTAGNENRATDRAYVRRNSVLDPENVELGATYRLNPEQAKVCPTAAPTIGTYSQLSEEVINQHVDQLQGAGVSRALVRINDVHDLEAAANIPSASLGGELPVEFRFGFIDWTMEGTPIRDQIQAMKSAIRRHPRYYTRQNRPVVSLRQIHTINYKQGQANKAWTRILSEFDSPGQFIDYLREELTVEGQQPYLVGETPVVRGHLTRPRMDETRQTVRLLKRLDAIRNTFDPVLQDSGNALALTMAQFKMDIRDAHLFAVQEGLDFEPVVVPGYLNSRGECPTDRQIPRDANRFEQLLAFAAYYSTSNRIVIDSFNDWIRGTQIEPGSMAGTSYGQSYIEAVQTVAESTEFVTQSERTVYHVDPEGSDLNSGSESEPLKTIQEGIMRAHPGDTVRVHPGEYNEKLRTVRDGTPDAPITITGSKEAVLRAPDGISVWIKNSHICLDGLTINGLLDPTQPNRRAAYSEGALINCRPPDDVDEYLRDIVVAPAQIGNSDRSLMVFNRTEQLEVGPTRVIGLAGAEYVLGDETSHVGEIVYIGTPPSQIDKDAYPWDEVDQINDVHIHHIDNSAGHPHSELVNTKLGSHDILVEYCSSAGGSQNMESYPAADVRLSGRDVTLRWCDLRDSQGIGVEVQHRRRWLENREKPAVSPDQNGAGHSIYGNVIEGYEEKALEIDTTPEEQRVICGNKVTGLSDGVPEKGCPTDLPSGDGIGHTGGDSPWA